MSKRLGGKVREQSFTFANVRVSVRVNRHHISSVWIGQMTTNLPSPPPEGRLIGAAREAAPRISIKKAARSAGISDTRWRQIEQGYRMHRGRAEAEPPAPAPILARMAHAVGITPAELESAGRADAADELRVMLATEPPDDDNGHGGEQGLTDIYERLRSVEEQLRHLAKQARGDDGGRASHAV